MLPLAQLALALVFIFITIFVLITARHLSLQRRRLACHKKPAVSGHGTTFFAQNTASIAIVLGSGGHTKEMILMLEAGFGKFGGMQRHYVVSSGDTQSLHAIKDFEDSMAAQHGGTGTWDVLVVRRARKVHQPLLITPFSAAISFIQIFPLLARLKPDIILTNGPATGFFVGVAAYLLRVTGLVLQAKLHVIYIESWARIKTLSLTGKLFYHTNMADTFLVQHEPIAKAYNVENAGWLVGGPQS